MEGSVAESRDLPVCQHICLSFYCLHSSSKLLAYMCIHVCTYYRVVRYCSVLCRWLSSESNVLQRASGRVSQTGVAERWT